jgi:hypothetical protein
MFDYQRALYICPCQNRVYGVKSGDHPFDGIVIHVSTMAQIIRYNLIVVNIYIYARVCYKNDIYLPIYLPIYLSIHPSIYPIYPIYPI